LSEYCHIADNPSYFCRMKTVILFVTMLFLLGCRNVSDKNTINKDSLLKLPAELQLAYADVLKYPDSIELKKSFINSLDSAKLYKYIVEPLDQLIKNDSLNHLLWIKKAQLYENLKDSIAAKKYYQYSINIYPTPAAMLGLANLLAEQKDSSALIVCTNAKTLFQEKENHADIYFIQGVYYVRKGNTLKANQYFDSCINANYRYFEAFMEKGFILFDNSKYKDALAIFETILKLDPFYADAYYWSAKCFENMGNFEAAKLNFEKAVNIDPELIEATKAFNKLQQK